LNPPTFPHQSHHKSNPSFTNPPNKQNNPTFTALPGAVELVSDMLESEIPSAVISNLPLEAIEAVLDAIGLKV
jgi:beta-phosphoglucomutase-like phosphatase (HAD superfamily)